LQKINEEELFADCYAEKKEAIKYGAGCIQKFGVTMLRTKNGKYLYAAGKDSEGTEFVKWDPLPGIKIEGLVFSSTDVMKGFFNYEWSEKEVKIAKPVVFIANYKVIQGQFEVKNLSKKTIIASGTKTWLELSKRGYWVTASADALGFEFLLASLSMPLLNITAEDISILTHEAAAERWGLKGYNALSNYKQIPKNDETIRESIVAAEAIFWTSFSQYEIYGKYAKPDGKHLCAGGETAELLKKAGVEPVIFPTIQAFEIWRRSSIRSHSVA
jgi:uroporphyrinogen-III synthase